MTNESIKILQFLFGLVAALFVIIAAFFQVWEKIKNDEFEPTRIWFRTKWNVIKSSYWLELPEKVIEKILNFKKNISTIILNLYSILYSKFGRNRHSRIAVFFAFSIARIIAFYSLLNVYTLHLDPYIDDTEIALIIILLLFLCSIIPTFISIITKKENFWIRNFGLITFHSIFAIYTSFLMFFPYLSYALHLPMERAFTHIISISIFIFFTYSMTLYSQPNIRKYIFENSKFNNDKFGENVKFFMFAFSTSLIVTSISLYIGKISSPHSDIPKTLQLFIFNSIFDGITLITTYSLLSWAIKHAAITRIPIAIFFDIMLSALWACLSLYIGLFGSEKSLTLHEVLNILIARSPQGDKIELGAYFWVMHTTFIPTLITCFLILIGWLCKLILIPVKYFFGVGQENKNPLKLTASVSFFIAAIFSFFSYLIGYLL